jgi:translation initiation factor 2B subunit (eIF-2B alpha/beta/delta family)
VLICADLCPIQPVYVAAESYKFARLYPLNQRDLPIENLGLTHDNLGLTLPDGVRNIK